MKDKFIKELRMYLDQYDIIDEIVEDIVSDHIEIIDEAINAGKTEEEIINILGTPKSIAKALRGEKKNRKESNDETLVALSPFIAVIAFMLLGFLGDLWHPGWLVFFIIPIIAILVNVRRDGIMTLLTALSPFVAVIAFMALGYYKELWHPGWLVFFIIPFFGYLTHKSITKKLLGTLSILVSVAGYLALIIYFPGSDKYAWLVFILPLLIGIYFGDINIGLNSKDTTKQERIFVAIVFITIATYLGIGFWTELWHPLWLIMFMIPVMAIIMFNDEKKFNWVAISPFISVTAYIIAGTVWDLWHIAWLVFFLIPILGVISGTRE